MVIEADSKNTVQQNDLTKRVKVEKILSAKPLTYEVSQHAKIRIFDVTIFTFPVRFFEVQWSTLDPNAVNPKTRNIRILSVCLAKPPIFPV